jgi:DNA end-binding protein Ku
MQAEKGGDKAYALLRDSLGRSGKVGLAKVVIKERQHLAALKSQQNGLMLELMRFPEEIIDASEFKTATLRNPSKAEENMAVQLIESMSTKWEPANYHDDYRQALEKIIEQKIEHGGEGMPAPRTAKRATPAVDLVAVLQQSIRQTQKRPANLAASRTNGRPSKSRHQLN